MFNKKTLLFKKILLVHYFRFLLPIISILIIMNPGKSSAQIFSKVNSEVINTPRGGAYGVGWIDFNGDGYLDILVTNCGSYINLYINNKDGSFTLSDNPEISKLFGCYAGIAWGDYDNDGYPDLFLTTDSGNNVLFNNLGNGNFKQVTSSSITVSIDLHMHCTWVDYDNDGWLDMYIPTVSSFDFAKGGGKVSLLYHNNGDGTFTKVTGNAVTSSAGNSSCGNFADYDNDGDMDLFVTQWEENNWLFENNGDGSFTKITGTEVNNNSSISSTCAWGDYDNDGYMDLFVGNGSAKEIVNQKNYLYHNNGNKTFTKVTTGDAVNIDVSTFTSLWGDVDNDGDLDLFIGQYGDTNMVFLNDGKGILSKTNAFDIPSRGTSGAGFGDFDNDGFLDLFVADVYGKGNTLYHNNRNNNNWINITCIGTVSNRSAIGARVKIKATIFGQPVWQIREINGNQGFRSFSDIRAHFGLGDATIIDSLIIDWPTPIGADSYKQRTVQTDVKLNQFLTITENIPVNYLKPLFKADIITGFSPLKVKFSNLSVYNENDPNISWSWDFNGDGKEDSNEKNPTFTYDCYLGNTFSVSLKISNSAKTETITKENFIKVLPAYEENLAVNKKVTASSYSNKDIHPALHAVDGNTRTYWQSSTSAEPQWFQVELDSEYMVNKVTINWGTLYAAKYNIQSSSDGNNWSDIIAIENGDGKNDEVEFNPTKIKYIRLYFIQSSVNGYRINELGIFRPKTLTAVESGIKNAVVSEFGLYQNYPNPFNPETTISYQLPEAGHVELKVFDMLGRGVASLVDEEQNQGRYEVKFNGDHLSSGVYLCVLKCEKYSAVKKLLLLR